MNPPLPRVRRCGLALLVSGVITALPGGASVIVAEHNWDSGPHPWYTQYDSADLTASPAGGSPNGWLTVSFPETDLGYNITDQVAQTQAWTTVTVSLGYSAAWGSMPLFDDTIEHFLADLSSIDWIGVYIFRDNSGMEIYGIDNFRLLVPEPAEWALLAAVLAGARWRRRQCQGESAALTPAAPGADPLPPREPPIAS